MTDAYYLAFTQDTPYLEILTRFQEKYGRVPEAVLPAPGNILLVGPLSITEQPGQQATQYKNGQHENTR